MKKNKSLIVVVLVALLISCVSYAEEVIWERDGRGRLTGKIIRLEEGESLPVSGTLSLDKTGLADSTRQDTGNEYLATIAENTRPDTANAIKTAVEAVNTAIQSGGITHTQLEAIKTALEVLGNVVDGSEAQVDVVSSALPTGAATETTLAGIENKLTDTAITETMVVIEMTTKDTEYSYTLPANTIYFFARESSGARDIRYSSLSGQTADDGVYQTIYAKEAKESPLRATDKIGAKTLYFRDKTNDATRVILEIWTK